MSDKNLIAALIAAQAEFPKITKGKEVEVQTKSGGKYSYRYAPLDSIVEAVAPVLRKHKLSIVQDCIEGAVSTIIIHESGERWQLASVHIEPAGPGGQDAGGALTYARRYSLTMALGLVTEDDDDLNRQSGREEYAHLQGDPPWICPKCEAPALNPMKGGKLACWERDGGCEAAFPNKAAVEQAWGEKDSEEPAKLSPGESQARQELLKAVGRFVDNEKVSEQTRGFCCAALQPNSTVSNEKLGKLVEQCVKEASAPGAGLKDDQIPFGKGVTKDGVVVG